MEIVAQKISNSELLIQWLDAKVDGVAIPSNLRCRLAGGCLDVVLEHQKSILLLVDHQLIGSAFALVRLIFEAYIRGVWLHQCATEVELNLFKKGKLEKKFFELLNQIEMLEAFDGKVLSEVKKRAWVSMNSFTHTGFDQVVRRNTADSIEPNYDNNEILEALGFANALGLLSVMEIAQIGNNEALANEVLEKIKNDFQFMS